MDKKNTFKPLLIKAIYISPGWLQDAVSFFYCYYFMPLTCGPVKYLKFYDFLKKSQWWPQWKLEQYQAEKLRQLLRYAYKNVPYYTDAFKKLNLTPDDFNSIKDLRKLPILTKEDLVKNLDKLTAQRIDKKYLVLVSTSGSTGKPMPFYRDKRCDFIELAFCRRIENITNIKFFDRSICLWSRPFIEGKVKDIYLFEPHLRRMSLSTVPHSLNLLPEYIRLIKQFKPIFISGNPSMLYNLACFAQEENIRDVRFGYFISGLENMFLYQRELIENQFNCKVFNRYSCEEHAVSALECPKQEGMHIEMERGILEIANEDGQVLPEQETGRIIATGLHNYAMPLIRYDTGDVGAISKIPCSCGRGLPLLKSLDGRINESIKYKDKTIYSTTLSVILWQFKNIKECQFVQENENGIKINIVKRKDYSEKDTRELIAILRKIIDDKLSVSMDFVDYIPRTKMGKFPFIISKVKNNHSREFHAISEKPCF